MTEPVEPIDTRLPRWEIALYLLGIAAGFVGSYLSPCWIC